MTGRNAIVRRLRTAASERLPRPIVAAWQVYEWRRQGRPTPAPPAVKQREIRRYAQAGSIRTFVETGTFRGDTVDALRRRFDHLYSIELNDEFHRRAKARFAGNPHITLLQGDSGSVLPKVLVEARGPCMFWLDAHHSGGDTARGDRDTPIIDEIRYILERHGVDDVILIDDARHFVGDNDYPTIAELRSIVEAERPSWVFEVRDDIIRTHPPSIRI